MIRLKKSYQEGNIAKAEYISKMYQYHDNLYQYAGFLPETNVKRIVIEDNQVYMETRDLGIKLLCRELDERIIPIEMLNFNDYEREELDMIDKILTILQAETFFDIGANVGYISIFVGKKHKDISVYSFEPVGITYEMLETNVRNNNMKNIKTYNVGCSNKKGEFSFFYYPQGCGNSSLQNLSGREDVSEITCRTDLLDSLYQGLGEERLDFIKCDVEGAEFMVLKGGKHTISEKKPVVFLELLRKWSKEFLYTPNDVIKFMKEIGYECYCIRNKKLSKITEITEETVETNFVFLHKDKHSALAKELG